MLQLSQFEKPLTGGRCCEFMNRLNQNRPLALQKEETKQGQVAGTILSLSFLFVVVDYFTKCIMFCKNVCVRFCYLWRCLFSLNFYNHKVMQFHFFFFFILRFL